ncbi:MAG: hypothetical protein HFE72_05205 [Emergencia sp.]|nr:hypothetical protein [Emergencia sp.]
MNGKDLLTGLSYMHEDVISDIISEAYAPAHKRKARSRNFLKGFGLAAACICIAVTGVFLHRQGLNAPATELVRVELSDIAVSELASFSADKIHVPNNCVEEVWAKEEINAYFGRNLWPVYIPNGLGESPNNDKQSVLMLDGKLYLDEISLDFYHSFYEDGMPMMTKGVNAERGFTLSAWKKGMSRDYMWISEEQQPKTSLIGNTEVTFGHREMEYGPYDENTHAPEGTYDLYVATFIIDDVHYEFVSHQLPLSELVKVITSFICETEQVVVE